MDHISLKKGDARLEAVMPAKGLKLLPFIALAGLASGTLSAQEQPRSMLGASDMKSIVLSPAPLGPPAQFEPPAGAAKMETRPAVAKSETAAPIKVTSTRSRQKPTVAAQKPKVSPLNSYARDARRQSWPCAGGGICAWTQPR